MLRQYSIRKRAKNQYVKYWLLSCLEYWHLVLFEKTHRIQNIFTSFILSRTFLFVFFRLSIFIQSVFFFFFSSPFIWFVRHCCKFPFCFQIHLPRQLFYFLSYILTFSFSLATPIASLSLKTFRWTLKRARSLPNPVNGAYALLLPCHLDQIGDIMSLLCQLLWRTNTRTHTHTHTYTTRTYTHVRTHTYTCAHIVKLQGAQIHAIFHSAIISSADYPSHTYEVVSKRWRNLNG